MQQILDSQKIHTTVLQIVLENLPGATPETLTEKTPLFQLGLSSLNAVSLVLGLEQAFGFQFDLDSEIDFLNFRSVASMIALVERKLKQEVDPATELSKDLAG